MPMPRVDSAHVVFSGRIYVFGGRNQWTIFNVAHYYDPLTNEWQTIAPIRYQRLKAVACVSNGFIYVVGGNRDRVIERCDCNEDSWTTVSCSLCLIPPQKTFLIDDHINKYFLFFYLFSWN